MNNIQNIHEKREIVLNAIAPSIQVTDYLLVTEGKGKMAVRMPRLFVDLGDDFKRWYEEEKDYLLNDLFNEFNRNGKEHRQETCDLFTAAWSNEQYYNDLIVTWERWNEAHLVKQEEAVRVKNYPQSNYYQKQIYKNRDLILKANAALWFIRQTKAFIKPAPTSTDKKAGRTKDPYNAKIKAKFLEMVIEAGDIKDEIDRNNDEKFARYANILKDKFGLVVSAGTLENNWRKPLKPDEKEVLRKLFITQDLKKLAVKVVTVGK